VSKSKSAAIAAILFGSLLCGSFYPSPFGRAVDAVDAVAPQRHQETSVHPDQSSITSISGLIPNRMTSNEIMFFRGWCSDSTGKYRIVLARNTVASIDRVGPNGVDSAESRAAGELYPYVIGNTKSGNAAIILSSQISYSKVVRPKEYDVIRKLRWGVVLVDDQIPPFHFSGWGNPFTRLTLAGTTPEWQVLPRSSSTDRFSAISLRSFLPDNARMAYILIRADNTDGARAGSAFIRVTSGQGDGLQIGELAGGQVAYFPLHQRVTSRRELFYKTTGDVTLEIWVLGYTNTEPS